MVGESNMTEQIDKLDKIKQAYKYENNTNYKIILNYRTYIELWTNNAIISITMC